MLDKLVSQGASTVKTDESVSTSILPDTKKMVVIIIVVLVIVFILMM